MELWGNATTFNLENVLRQNIVGSDYYKTTCLKLSNFNDIVDEIYESVDHVEPWMSGNARGASTAFCLVHRLFTMKLSAQQVKTLLDHHDSPYIRAVGFLYLRYVIEPKTLWSWCLPYVKDAEMFAPSGTGQKEVTMGDYVRDLLLSQYYFETIFPRIPKPVEDSIKDELKSRNLPTAAKGNGGAGGVDRRGMEDSSTKRPASVKASLSVAFGQRAPNRANVREEGRGRDPSLHTRDGPGRGSASPEPQQRADRSGRDDRPARADRSGRDDRAGRDERGGRDERAGRDERTGRDANKEAARPRSRSMDRNGRRDLDRDDRSTRDGRDARDHDRRSRYDDNDRKPSRDRERSRSRERGRDARDVFRQSAQPRGGSSDDLRPKYGDASARDRERSDRDRDGYRNGSGARR